MDNKVRDEGRLKIALNILEKRQTASYTKQCHRKNPTVLDRLSIATSLFDDDDQANKFAELVAKHEGFIGMPPRACKGICQTCKISSRDRCSHYIEADVVVGERLNVCHKRKRKDKL